MDVLSSRAFTAYDAAWTLLSIARTFPTYLPRRSGSSHGLDNGHSRAAGQSMPGSIDMDDGSDFAENGPSHDVLMTKWPTIS